MEKQFPLERKILKVKLKSGRTRIRVQQIFDPSSSLTKQSFKEECDINNIVRKLEKGMPLQDLIKANPQYGDFSDVPSYQESLERVMFAQEQFYALDSEVRDRFQNDPAKFLEFANDPKNMTEMVNLGLAKKRPASLDDIHTTLKASQQPRKGKQDATGGKPTQDSNNES